MKTLKLLVIICMFTIPNLSHSQNPYLIQVDQCLQQLEQLSSLGAWEDSNFTNNYQMFIDRGESLIVTLEKNDSATSDLPERKKLLKNFKNLLDTKGKTDVAISSGDDLNNGLNGLLKKGRQSITGLRKKMNPELYNRIEDNGTPNSFHKNNIGTIKFGEYTYGASFSSLKTEFTINNGFNYYLFLSKAIHNLALDQQESTGDDRWFAKSDNRILFSLYVSDRLVHSWIEISPAQRDYDEKSTFFSGECITKKPIDVNYTSGFYHYLGKKFIVWHMEPGTYNVSVEAYLFNQTIQDEGKVKIAEGTFKLKATKADLEKFLDERNQLEIISRTIQNSCNHNMIIEKVRGKYSGERITYPPGVRTSGAFDTGDKLYVINPTNGKRKFLMEVTDDTQIIAFNCKW
ncbi:hypothetical protein [Aquimarina rubra]|uniref:Uncharacterized protein n=1 Tax=Aquimarina rubra TaxID=1920033 RepID=A0ABW5LEH0_9FLAO